MTNYTKSTTMSKNGRCDGITTLTLVLHVLLHLTSSVKADECGTKFTDPVSSAVLAHAVIRGSIRGFNPNSGLNSGQQSANVTVNRVYKGQNVVDRTRRDDVLVVGQFAQEEDRDGCVASPAIVVPDVEHIFFLRQTANRNELEISAFPLQSDTKTINHILGSLCPTCIRPPHIKKIVCKMCASAPQINPRSLKHKKVPMGRRVRMVCYAKGRPNPGFSWSNDGIPIASGSGGITIKTTKKRSTLILRRTTNAHAGEYTCKAKNQIGEDEKSGLLELTRSNINPCRHRSGYCLNGGQCIHNEQSERVHCSCPDQWMGARCQFLKYSPPPPALTTDHQSTAHSRHETTSEASIHLGHSEITETPDVITMLASHSGKQSTVETTRKLAKKKKASTYELNSQAKNSQLKVVFCKEKRYCKNGGKCRYVVKLGHKFCQCRAGFAGKQCELQTQPNLT